jgi:hypothetical protein
VGHIEVVLAVVLRNSLHHRDKALTYAPALLDEDLVCSSFSLRNRASDGRLVCKGVCVGIADEVGFVDLAVVQLHGSGVGLDPDELCLGPALTNSFEEGVP